MAPGSICASGAVARRAGQFRFMLDRKAREMGLGGLTKVSLADARKKTVDARLLFVRWICLMERTR